MRYDAARRSITEETTMTTSGRYQKILVPLDGSEWAQRAIPHAVDIAHSHPEAELVLLTAIVPPTRDFAEQLAFTGEDGQTQIAREQIKQYLIGVRGDLRSEAINVTIRLSEGTQVADAICDTIQREAIDLVVMSTHGRTGVARLLFGSVARDVLERVTVPVLLIRPDQEA